MSKYIIEGGRPLQGKIKAAGAKNSSGKLILASILTQEPVFFENVPRSGEVEIALEIVQAIGANYNFSENRVQIETKKINTSDITYLSGRNRHPVLAIGPLLFRTGEANVPLLGGDKIGRRPINFHLDALKKLGAKTEQTASSIKVTATHLVGTTINLPYPSVGATETLLLTTTWAEGRSQINNAAIEPEILQLIEFLNSMGAKIERHHRQINIEGVKKFSGTKTRVIPDRLEVASYACLALASRGNIFVEDANPKHLKPFLDFINQINGQYSIESNGIRFCAPKKLTAATITTNPYPGFSTDWQQPAAVVLCTAEGISVIHETVYSNRLEYTRDLTRMGANINILTTCQPRPCRYDQCEYKHVAIIKGPTQLKGCDSIIPDIRAGMAQIIAALISEGRSELTGIEHLKRGYDSLIPKLQSLGANIEEV